MKILLLIFLLSLCLKLNAKWEPLSSPSGINYINNIYTHDDFYFFSRGTNFFVSNDKGENWENISPNGLDSIGLMNTFYGFEDTLFITSSGLKDQFLGGLYKSTNKGKSWINIFKNSNYSSCYHFNIANNIYYLLSTYGLIKSSNFGLKWDTINIKSSRLSYMKHLETKGDTIMLSDVGLHDEYKETKISNYGIYFSFDSGKSWELRVNGIGLDSTINNVIKLYDNICLVGTNKGLYKSSDFGLTWIKQSNFNHNIIKIEKNNNHFYIGTNEGEIYKSTDITSSWNLVYKSNSKDPITVLYKVENELLFSQSGLSTGIFKLTENGFEEYIIPIKSTNYKILYRNNKLYMLSNLKGIYYSEDFGKNWNILNDSLNKYRFKKTKMYIEDSIFLAYNITDNYITISNDYGKTWINKYFFTSYISAFLINGRILVFDSNNYRYFSDDGGRTWININEEYGENPEGIFYINKIMSDNNNLLAITTFNGLIKSTDNGITWYKLIEQEYPPHFLEGLSNFSIYNNTIIASKIDRYEGTGNSLLISNDLGKTWSEKIFSDYQIRFKEIKNYRNNFFISSSLGFHYSTDNGNTWNIYNDGLPINDSNESALIGDFEIIGDKIIVIESENLYELNFSELDIEYTTVETRSYLYLKIPYPQPSDNIINLKFYYWDESLVFNSENVELYDINSNKIDLNKILTIIKIGLNESKIELDVSKLNFGIYFLKIKYGTEIKFKKIIISK